MGAACVYASTFGKTPGKRRLNYKKQRNEEADITTITMERGRIRKSSTTLLVSVVTRIDFMMLATVH